MCPLLVKIELYLGELKNLFMTKNYFLKMFAGVALFGLLASCNTTSDPTESIPDPVGGPSPKKFVARVAMDNVTQEEYTSTTAGVLQQITFKDDNAPAFNYIGSVTYQTGSSDPTIQDISQVTFMSPATGSLDYTFDIIPAEKGKIFSASCKATGATPSLSYLSDYAFSYDVITSKLTKILEKRKDGGISAYNKFIEYTFVYAGKNIFQVICKKGILNNLGAPDFATAKTSTYNFQNYDSNNSPFSMLPQNFSLIRGLVNPALFYRMSPNNPTSMYFEMPAPTPSVNTGQSYSYDNEKYPVVEKNQKVTFTYKKLEGI